jgi:hypothetical protein
MSSNPTNELSHFFHYKQGIGIITTMRLWQQWDCEDNGNMTTMKVLTGYGKSPNYFLLFLKYGRESLSVF